MMGRIRNAYELRFRRLLSTLRPRHLELGVHLLLERADRLSQRQAIPLAQALAQVYQRVRAQVRRRNDRMRRCDGPAPGRPPDPGPPVEFVCDAGLGGLARWLRAAGYEAHWNPAIDDDDLIRAARNIPAMLLTTDSLLMERGVLRDGLIPSLWVPPSLKKFEQLHLVLNEFQLPVRQPRCMSCGGDLREVDKESVRERIPPKTYRWREEYFVCCRCDKLFWRGTHWNNISQRLAKIGCHPPGSL
jgi:hypothetical protein